MTGMRFLLVLVVLGTHAAAAADTDALHGADARSRVLVADAASPDTSDSSLRQRAEDLARAASQRFSEILSADKPAPQPGAGKPAANPGSETFAPVWNWLARASQDYEDIVISKLKSPDGWVVVVQRADATAPVPAPDKQAEPQPEPRRGWSGLMEVLRDWLASANRSYRNEIVKRLVEPSEQEAQKAAAEEPARAAPPSAPTPPSPSATAPAPSVAPPQAAPPVVVEAPRATPYATEAKRKAETEDRVKREAEAADAKRKADAEAQAKREAATAEAQRKADMEAEAKRVAAAAEAKRKADAEAQAKREAATAEAKRKADAEAQAKREAATAEAKRKAEDEKRLAEEGDAERKAVAEAEATRLATEAEEKRKAEREAKSRRAVQAATEAAAANAAPAAAKEPEKTENSDIAPGRNAATSLPAPAESAPAKSASPSSAPERPARTASPDSSKPSAVVGEEPVPPKATSKKQQLAQVDTGRERAHVRRHKPVAHVKHRKHGHGHVYSYKKPRAVPVETLYPGPRCKRQCRCAGVNGYRHVRLAKPRKHAVWRGHAAPRFYASESQVRRPYRVHHSKVGRASLTYRHHRLYIPSQTY